LGAAGILSFPWTTRIGRAKADRLGCTLAQMALAWNLHQPGVTALLAGSRNHTHVRENADAAAIELTPEQLAELDALIPLGPLFAQEGVDP